MLSNNYRFVISAVKSTLNNKPIDEKFEKLNFEKIFNIALSHCIVPLVYKAITISSNIDVPEEILKKFSNTNKMMIMSSVARNNSITEVCESFRKKNIEYILLKGAVIQNFYPEKFMRYSTDTDILVKEKDYEKTAPVLKELSYKFDSQNDKHYVFYKKPYVCIEIHKKLSRNNFFDNAWENSEKFGEETHLKKEFELTYLVCHMAENFSKTAAVGVHSIVDLYLYLQKFEKEIDEKHLRKNFEKVGILKFFESIKELSKIWFEDKESNEFFDELTNFIFEGKRSGNEINAASVKIDNKKPIAFAKISFLFSKIFLPYKDLKKIYPILEKIPFCLPVFWIMRITGIVFRPEHRGFKRASSILKNTNTQKIKKTKKLFDELELNDKQF